MLSVTAHRDIVGLPDIAKHCTQVHTGLATENRWRYTAQSILTCFKIYYLPTINEARDIIHWAMGDTFHE